MKTSIMKYALYLSGVLLFGLGACDDSCQDPCNPECENYDPCCPVKAADASFTVLQRPVRPREMRHLSFEPIPIDQVVYGYTALELKAPEGFSDYQYLFIRDGRIVSRPSAADGKPSYYWVVGNAAEPFDLRIRLQVTQEAAKSCGKDTFDAQEQVIRVVPFGDNPIFGRYRGNYQPPHALAEDFEVNIEKANYMDPGDTLWYEDHIKNPIFLHPDCDGMFSKVSESAFMFSSIHNRCCKRTEAIGKLTKPNEIQVLINEQDVPACENDYRDPRREKVFYGTRIQ